MAPRLIPKLCLAALLATASAWALGAPGPFLGQAGVQTEAAASGDQAVESAPPEYGGAIYSPFSTATSAPDRAADARVTATQRTEEEAEAGLAVTAVSAVVAAGLVLAVVRALTL